MTAIVNSHPECYARALCDCRGQVSGEHVVSQTLLEGIWPKQRGGRVYGLTFNPGTQDDPAILGIKSLTAKILCEGHNSALTDYDTEMRRYFDATERLVLAEIERNCVGENRYVNGDRLERWMLKTLCGGLYSGNFPVPFEQDFAGVPPLLEYLQALYRGGAFPVGWGMHIVHDPSKVDHHVFRLAVIGAPEGVVGLRMWVFGTQHILVLSDKAEHFPELAKATYRPAKLVTEELRNGIVFSWSGPTPRATLQIAFADTPPESHTS